jgi:ABC-type Zn uptake system ZnuABC Zn-binding protein ZnuA
VETNAPPGPTIAVLAGGAFLLIGLARVTADGARRAPAAPASAALLVVLLGAGCGSTGTADDGRPVVVATTTQIADFTRAVAGDEVHVVQLLKPNTDPHDYEPRPGDVQDAADARLVFANGDGLDHWIGDVVESSGGDAPVVDLGASVPDRIAGEEAATDPHWWHDTRNAIAAVEEIRDRLAESDPAHARTYRRNASAYLAQLSALDSGIARCMESVPAGDRKLVTNHDALGYFTRRYGVQVVGAVIPSQSTQAQPNARDVSDLVQLIEDEDVKAIFPESSLSAKLADAIARQTGITAQYELYGDTLGPKDSAGATDLGMMQATADALARGFTGGKRGCRIAGIDA